MDKRRQLNRYRKNLQVQRSAMSYILESLVPFTNANLNLVFSPNRFFNELEKIDAEQRYKRQTLRNSFYLAKRKGLIEFDDEGIPRLTEKGERHMTPYVPQKLSGDARLFVIFDIPETERRKRLRLRTILQELKFQQVQKSVWMTSYDHRNYLRAEIEYSGLAGYVEVYEANRLL